MKILLAITFILYSIPLLAQRPVEKLPTDSNFKVIDATIKFSKEHPAYFLNNLFVGENFLSSVDADCIKTIDVKKIDTVIKDQKYESAIYLTTKQPYQSRPISLTALKDKYLRQNGEVTVFMIDGNIISTNYDTYMLDENKLLRLIIDEKKNPAENINLNLIKILTKNKTNVASLNIRVRR